MLCIQWQLPAAPNKERVMANASFGSQTFHEEARSHKCQQEGQAHKEFMPQVDVNSTIVDRG